jgi:hypothetical protein
MQSTPSYPASILYTFNIILPFSLRFRIRIFFRKGFRGAVVVQSVPDYGLDDRRSKFDPQQRQEYFFCSLCVQTGSGLHPASCTIGTEGPFPRGKVRPGRDSPTHPHLVPRSRMSRSYTSSPPLLLYRYVVGLLFFTYGLY